MLLVDWTDQIHQTSALFDLSENARLQVKDYYMSNTFRFNDETGDLLLGGIKFKGGLSKLCHCPIRLIDFDDEHVYVYVEV